MLDNLRTLLENAGSLYFADPAIAGALVLAGLCLAVIGLARPLAGGLFRLAGLAVRLCSRPRSELCELFCALLESAQASLCKNDKEVQAADLKVNTGWECPGVFWKDHTCNPHLSRRDRKHVGKVARSALARLHKQAKAQKRRELIGEAHDALNRKVRNQETYTMAEPASPLVRPTTWQSWVPPAVPMAQVQMAHNKVN